MRLMVIFIGSDLRDRIHGERYMILNTIHDTWNTIQIVYRCMCNLYCFTCIFWKEIVAINKRFIALSLS